MNITATNPGTWSRERDDYGRSVHHLRDGWTTVGVVVRVPRWTPDSILPSPYFVTEWAQPGENRSSMLIGHHVPTLADGKALIQSRAMIRTLALAEAEAV